MLDVIIYTKYKSLHKMNAIANYISAGYKSIIACYEPDIASGHSDSSSKAKERMNYKTFLAESLITVFD